jgi:hypothetical protein
MDSLDRITMQMLDVCDTMRGADPREMALACTQLRGVRKLTQKNRLALAARWRRMRDQKSRNKVHRLMCLYCIAENNVKSAKAMLEVAVLRERLASRVNWVKVCMA